MDYDLRDDRQIGFESQTQCMLQPFEGLPMSVLSRAARTSTVLAILPMSFFGILYTWYMVDTFFGCQQVAAFIKSKEQYVQMQRLNPSVHSISLSHDPQHSGTLLIQFDVEDAQTYLRLEDELWPKEDLRFSPRYETNLRSKENLGNNWGFAAVGIGEAAEGGRRIFVAALACFFLGLVAVRIETRSARISRASTSTAQPNPTSEN